MTKDGQPLHLRTEPDFSAAPFTGWTRRHWEEAGRTLLRNALAHAEPGASSFPFHTPHVEPPDSARIESFARVMLLAGPVLADARAVPDSAERARAFQFFRDGIVAGTDPSHPSYWGDVTDTSHHLVELPSIAWFLYVTRPHFWDPLPEKEKNQVVRYLARCNEVSTWPNNWMAFDVITNAVLKRLGMPYSEGRLDQRLHGCDALHAGGGWYRDRDDLEQYDYYNFWVFHRHLLQWAVLDGGSNPQLVRAFMERADQALADLRYFVAADGATPFFGRSLTYRFAFVSPIAGRLRLGPSEVSLGELRTVASLTTKFFCDRPILTPEGNLSLGNTRPSEPMLEDYSYGGSPYWAGAAFDLLLLPPEHAFWRAREAPLPIHRGSFAVALEHPGFLLLGERKTGHVQLINHKSYHFHLTHDYNVKYGNFAYSSAFPYEPRAAALGMSGGNALEWSMDEVHYHQRQRMEPLHLSSRLAASRYRLAGLDGESEVTTFVLVKGDVMVNVHRAEIRSPMYFRESGYSLGFDADDPEVVTGQAGQAVLADGRSSYLRGLYGYREPGPPHIVHGEGDGDTGPRQRHSAIPVLHAPPSGPGVVYLASLVCASTEPGAIETLDALVDEVHVHGSTVRVRFGDGETVVLNFSVLPRFGVGRMEPRGTEAAVSVAANGTRDVLARHRPWTEPAIRGWVRSVRRRVQRLQSEGGTSF